MKKVTEFLDNYVVEFDWKDIGIFKVCMTMFGLMLGLSVPAKKKKPLLVVATVLFTLSAIALIARLIGVECPFCNKDEEWEDWEEWDDGADEKGFVMKISSEE